jgi:hypothetical protein
MKRIRPTLFGAGLLGLGIFVVCAGHEWLSRSLVAPFGALGIDPPERFATVTASLLVHVLAGVFVLPWALRLTRLGIAADAVRLAFYTAFAMVFVRAAVEAGTGLLLHGMPLASGAAAVTAFAVLRNRAIAPPRPAVTLRAVAGGRTPRAAVAAGRREAS